MVDLKLRSWAWKAAGNRHSFKGMYSMNLKSNSSLFLKSEKVFLKICSVNFVSSRAAQANIYFCYLRSLLFTLSPPPLSVLCNVILVSTRAPPPRPLTFSFGSQRDPRGSKQLRSSVQPPYYSASTGLIWLIKVAAVKQLTEQEPLAILLLHCSCALLCRPHSDEFSLRVGEVNTGNVFPLCQLLCRRCCVWFYHPDVKVWLNVAFFLLSLFSRL